MNRVRKYVGIVQPAISTQRVDEMLDLYPQDPAGDAAEIPQVCLGVHAKTPLPS